MFPSTQIENKQTNPPFEPNQISHSNNKMMPKSITAILNTLKTKNPLTKLPLKHYTTTLNNNIPISSNKYPYTYNTTTPKEKVDCVVVGCGIVGMAIATALSNKGRHVLVIECGPTFGCGTSSRNSEVIHAGIYYPHQSLKAKLCVKGREMLYKYCSEHDVPHKQIGKLIVATREQEIPKLNNLLAHGTKNGVQGLRLMDASEAMRVEPKLQCVKALYSPFSGIVDSHSFMLSLLGEAENIGAIFSYNTTVLGGYLEGNQIVLLVTGCHNLENWNEEEDVLSSAELLLLPKVVINSAGLGAVSLAKRLVGLNASSIPPIYYARGHYFSLSKIKAPPFRHLIYPVPEDGGLGVHVTLDLNGQVKFGPDVEWIGGPGDIASFLNRFDYSVNPERAERFYPEIRKYYPELKDGSLEPGYAGIRPKLSGPGESPCDFVIQGEDVHGVAGLINLFGIESPGLTASLAIAEHVTKIALHII